MESPVPKSVMAQARMSSAGALSKRRLRRVRKVCCHASKGQVLGENGADDTHLRIPRLCCGVIALFHGGDRLDKHQCRSQPRKGAGRKKRRTTTGGISRWFQLWADSGFSANQQSSAHGAGTIDFALTCRQTNNWVNWVIRMGKASGSFNSSNRGDNRRYRRGKQRKSAQQRRLSGKNGRMRVSNCLGFSFCPHLKNGIGTHNVNT
jgi:hypothetical protein